MGTKLQIESRIRDWLADHLDFIASGLTLIEKEYPLHDPGGASGFVDLLCKDEFGNFVIIEIKRSENAARQTINEILKYHSLIKHNFKARESEIRIIIISTSWNELIRPFSELVHRTSLDVSGYQITIDDTYRPESKEQVQPLNLDLLTRKFTLRYGLFLFEGATERDNFYKAFLPYLRVNELRDFVSLKLFTDPLNGRIMFPFAAIVAFQQLPLEDLLGVIRNLDIESYNDLLPQIEFDDPLEYRTYLDSMMINALDTLGHFQESETCYASKVYTMLNAENWNIEQIDRFGIFASDPRFDKDLLVNELTGLDGSNENIFYGWTESTQWERFAEIRHQCRKSLMPSPAWLETIDAIMEKLSTESRRFRLMINIYNRRELVSALNHSIVNRNLEYLPQYFISVDYLDSNQTELYYGSLLWNNNWPESPWIKQMSSEELGERMMELMFHPDNQRDARELGLCYGTTKYNLIDTSSKFEDFLQGVDGKLESQNYYICSFLIFAGIHQESLENLVKNYNQAYVSYNA